MRRQPAQMSTLAAACVSPLHSASCAVDKSINRRAYASVYVRIRPYAEQRVGPGWPWSAFVIGWNACAGLRWPWKFNMFELWRRMRAYTRVCAGRNRRQKYKQLRRQSAYARVYARIRAHTRAWSINPALCLSHIQPRAPYEFYHPYDFLTVRPSEAPVAILRRCCSRGHIRLRAPYDLTRLYTYGLVE